MAVDANIKHSVCITFGIDTAHRWRWSSSCCMQSYPATARTSFCMAWIQSFKKKKKKAILFCILPKFTGGVLLILILKINPWHDWPVLWSLNGSSLQLDWPALVQPVACPQEALCVSVASLQWAWLPEWHCSVTWLWTLPHYLQQTQQAFQETYNSIFKFFIQSTPCWSKAAKYVFAGRWYTSRNDEDMN